MPTWRLHLDVVLVLGSVTAAYLIWVRRHEEETGEATPARGRRRFLIGMAVLFVMSSWPMHDLAERRWYMAHMVQHLSFTLVAAPLLVTGIPAWMWRAALRPRSLERAWRFLTRPVMALIVSNGVLLFTHWPAVVDASVRSEPLHFLLHTALLGLGVQVAHRSPARMLASTSRWASASQPSRSSRACHVKKITAM